MRFAEAGIVELQKCVDTQIIIPNQNLFRVANEKTTFADAFAMADQVLYSGVACITDLMVKEGLINLDFADVRAVMREMGKAMMGTGEASGEKRALRSAEAAIANPLIDDVSMKGARGLLISITGGKDLTLYEVDEAATRIREEVDQEANIIVGATFDESLEGIIRVSVVATGIDTVAHAQRPPADSRIAELTQRLRVDTQRIAAERVERHETQAQQPQLRAPAPAPVAAPVAPPPAPRPSFEQAATAAVAAALQPQPAMDDVTVRSITPKPSLFVEPMMAEPAPQEMPKAFIPPAARAVRARRACRGSTNCRCRRRTSFAPGRLSRPTPVRRSSACRCCSGWPRSGSAAARTSEARAAGPASRSSVRPCRRCRRASRPACRTRFRNTPSGRSLRRQRRRVSTCTAGRLCLCTSLWTRTSWKSRRSCAGRPTERRGLKHQDDPGSVPGSLQSGPANVLCGTGFYA